MSAARRRRYASRGDSPSAWFHISANAARTQHARDLCDGLVVRKPVERLTGEHRVGLGVADRNALCRTGYASTAGTRSARIFRSSRRAARPRSRGRSDRPVRERAFPGTWSREPSHPRGPTAGRGRQAASPVVPGRTRPPPMIRRELVQWSRPPVCSRPRAAWPPAEQERTHGREPHAQPTPASRKARVPLQASRAQSRVAESGSVPS